MALLPDGDVIETSINQSASLEGLTFSAARKTLTFWMLGAAFFLFSTAITGVAVHLIPHLEDVGFSTTVAVNIFSILNGLSLLSRLGFGYLSDRFDVRYVTILSYLLCAIGIGFLIQIKPSELPYLIGFIGFYGLAYGGPPALQPIIVAKSFGRVSIGKILGYLNLPFACGFGLGPFLIGYIFDLTNSYYWAFILFIFSYLIASIAILFTKISIWEKK